MRYFFALSVLVFAAATGLQSLSELARKEAERRQKLAEVQAKKIDGTDPADLAPGGAVSTSSGAPRSAPAPASARSTAGASLRSFQTRLQKIDRDIAQNEQKIKVLQLKADAEKWAPTKTSKGSKGSGPSTALDQMRWQIVELQGKINALRTERIDVLQEGKRAGYLPGELEGRVR